MSVALGSEPTLAEKRLHFYVLEVGLGEDRNQITCARSQCLLLNVSRWVSAKNKSYISCMKGPPTRML